MKNRLFHLIQNRWVQHFLFWSLSFVVLLRAFAYEAVLAPTDLIYTFLFHFSLLLVVYGNIRLLFPRLLQQQQRYFSYLGALACLVALSAWFNLLTFNFLTDWLFPGYYFIAYYEFRDMVMFTGIYAALSTLLKLSKGWFQLQQQEKRLAALEQEKVDAELRALKAQLDPHFLFNSLNGIYALALERDQRLPEMILKLAGGLRYILYDCRGDRVSLKRELNYIQLYLDLQRLRFDERVDIRFEQQGDAEQLEIAPLLFLPFMENGFKHGIRPGNASSFVHLFIELEEKQLRFFMHNSRRTKPAEEAEGGIGLANIRRRLALLYPYRHELSIHESAEEYKLTLQLQLK